MAYDKVVDSSVLDAGLTQIANTIREKAGTSDSLAFPDAMAAAIAAIEAGGGGSIVAGTYTPASTQTSRVTITHNLGIEPTGVLFAKYHTDHGTNDTVLFIWLTGGKGIRYMYYNGGANIAFSQVSASGANTQVHAQNHSNVDIVCGLTDTTFQTPKNLYADTYIWVVFGEVLK